MKNLHPRARFQMKLMVLALCVVCSFLFLANLQSRDFWAPDEGDFAEIARELESNPVVPHLNNQPYGEKPPLFYYLIYGSRKVLSFFREEVVPESTRGRARFSFRPLLFRHPSHLLRLEAGSPVHGHACHRPPFTTGRPATSRWTWSSPSSSPQACSFSSASRSREGSSTISSSSSPPPSPSWPRGPSLWSLMFPAVFAYLCFKRDFSLLKRKETYAGLLIMLLIILPWYMAGLL